MRDIRKSEIIELQFQGRVLNWLKEIIAKEKLHFDVDQEVPIRTDGKLLRADLVIWEDKSRTKTACIIELKRPEYNGYSLELTDNAMRKANFLGSPFFATWNVNEFVLWETFEEGTPLLDRRRWHKDVVAIKWIDEVKRRAVEEKLKKFLREFLTKDFVEICYVKKEVPTLPLDRIFIDRLKSAVNSFYIRISEDLQEEYQKREDFKQRLNDWFREQKWVFEGKEEDFDRVARLSVLLLIAKVVFYNFLKMRASGFELPPINIPTEDANRFKTILYEYFERCFGYADLFKREFIDDLPFPDDVGVIRQLKGFIKEMELYDFSKIGYEVLGSIFENLIPDDERHRFGQHFTRSDVVDLIIGFCVKTGDEKVLDPACGAGTFLTRAYLRKKKKKSDKGTGEILRELKGVDIAEFGCYLTRMNLAIKDIFGGFRSNVENTDFFDLIPSENEKFDAVVTNPPYTRQEEFEQTFSKDYKAKLKKIAKEEGGIEVGKRMSIYGYFFFHAARFLNEKGKVGFITSNSWLDVDYGKYLQEFFLKNFKIVAIIESKVERWFEYADVNTCIIILEKCRGESRRKKNLVKFVQLNKPLKDFIDLQNEGERWKSINKLVRFIENKKKYFEDERIRIYPVEQEKLWEEGFDEASGKYEGSKWGKYLRAPEIFFKILEKGKDLFVPLTEVADVRFGIKTGANEFFYLTEENIKKWGIEKEFLQPIIFTLKEVEGYSVDKNNLKFKVLICHKQKEELKGTNVLKYIEYGEERGREFQKRPTCGSRSPWYALGKGWNYAPLIFPAKVGERMPVFLNDDVFEDKKLYGVTPKNKGDTVLLGAFLNSTVSRLIVEHTCRQLTGAQAIADIDVVVVEHLGIPNPSELSKKIRAKLENSFRELSETSCDSIFEEIGANSPEEISLDKVKTDRRELDEIVMDKILGLTEEEQLEVYKAVVDLVKSRLEKAGSVPKQAKKKGVDIRALAEGILREIDISELKKFPGDYIGGEECREIEVSKGKPEVGSDLHGFFVKIGDARIECGSQEEAKYIEYAVLNGNTRIRIPKDERGIKKTVESYGSAYNKLKGDVSAYMKRAIQNNKIRERVEAVVWEKIKIKAYL
ncbi:MAG: N-6 DNA methylase [Euryarchaeota archaeon]|nr:N-6 DNA methylase [Euryarchaeota archaeon]